MSPQQTSSNVEKAQVLWPCIHAGGGLQEEVIRPRAGLPPLLQAAGERRPEPLQYLGSSFGLTQPLLNFWRRAGYQPVYLRQTASDVTGEPLKSPLRWCSFGSY